jgi:hypothetical protein
LKILRVTSGAVFLLTVPVIPAPAATPAAPVTHLAPAAQILEGEMMPDHALRAEQARERHRKAIAGDMHIQFEHIMNVISRACIDPYVTGELWFKGEIHPENRNTLVSWGYAIEQFTGQETELKGESGHWKHPHFSVSWSEK